MAQTSDLPVDPKFFAGVDVGGTKVAIMDNSSEMMHRYAAADYPNIDAILDDYFTKVGRRPARITLAMAGPRDDETGAITPTNAKWLSFEPLAAEKRYKGTHFETVNDMIGTTAGVLAEPRIEYEALKEGRPTAVGTKMILAFSTGFNSAGAIWDKQTDRYIFMASEGGHMGVLPQTNEEMEYLAYLQSKYPRASAELALGGKDGINNLIDHILTLHYDTGLIGAINRARESDRPVGAVLLEFATEGQGTSRDVARKTLEVLGSLFGSVTRDLALVFKATGGIYLTGSVALALGEYLVQETNFLERFIHHGAPHDFWLQHVPIYLVTDPHVAVKGSLSLAAQAS